MEIVTGYVDLKVSDGTSMRAYTARPKDAGTSVGLIVGQEAFGVNSHIRDVTERFARKGYISIAPVNGPLTVVCASFWGRRRRPYCQGGGKKCLRS